MACKETEHLKSAGEKWRFQTILH